MQICPERDYIDTSMCLKKFYKHNFTQLIQFQVNAIVVLLINLDLLNIICIFGLFVIVFI